MQSIVKHIFTLAFLFSSFQIATAQGVEWANSFSGTSNVVESELDAQGNIVLIGNSTFNQPVAYDGTVILPGTGNFQNVAYVMKVDSTGSLLWFQVFPGVQLVTDLELDSSGDIIFTGRANAQVVVGTDTLAFISGINYFVAKLNASGAGQWINPMTMLTSFSTNNVIRTLGTELYITSDFVNTLVYDGQTFNSYTSSTSSFNRNVGVLKIDANGGLIWGHVIESAGNVVIRDFEIANGNDLFMYATNFDTLYFNGAAYFNSSSSFTSNGYVLKMDTTGAEVAIQDLGTTSFSAVGKLQTDEANNKIYVGAAFTTLNFNTSLSGPILLRINENTLAVENAIQILGTTITDIEVYNSDVYFSGTFNNSISFLGTVYTALGGSSYMAKLNPAFTNGWFVHVENTASSFVTTNGSISISPTGTVYGTLKNRGNNTFGQRPVTGGNSTNDFVFKMNQCFPYSPQVIGGSPQYLCGSNPTQLAGSPVASSEFQWLSNNQAVPGADSLLYTVTNPGSYSMVVDSLGCFDTSNVIQVNQVALPSVSSPLSFNKCETDTLFTLTGGSPAGGVWTGVGVVNGTYDPIAQGTGSQLLTYSFTDNNGCQNSSQTIVSVLQNPTSIVLPITQTFCESSNSVTLTNGFPSGGMWSGPGVSGTSFDPAAAGAGTHDLVYTITNANGCVGKDSTSVTVNPAPSASVSALSNVCFTQFSTVLPSGTPSGGTWSGNGVVSNAFYPVFVGVGTYDLIYTVSSGQGCTGADTVQITVDSLPVANFSAVAPLCANAPAITLNTGAPAGGIYAGPGVSNGSFDPALASVGQNALTYSYTNACGTDVANRSVEVLPLPTVTMSAIAPICESANVLTLNQGSPNGGTYSGVGVSAGSFDPSVAGVGTYTITYTYSDNNGCENTATANVEVKPLPTVTLNLQSNICVNASPLTLAGGAPSGGTYSGTGVAAGIFNPGTAGVGDHVITYSFIDAFGCDGTSSDTITVDPLPNTALAAFTPVCASATPFALTGGTPVGGVYSGTGVSNGFFDPSVPTSSSVTITYTVNNTCGSNASSQSIQINPRPSISFTAINDVCVDAGSVTLNQASPAGGTYSGTGVTGNQFDPSVGTGSYFVTYTYTDGLGCVNQDSQSVTVNALPTVSVQDINGLCENGAAVSLSQGMPMGGTYSGSGVSAGSFDPTAVGAGNYDLFYLYTDGNGCSNTDTSNVEVLNKPAVSLAAQTSACASDGSATLAGGLPSGGSYFGTNISSGQFDIAASGAGTFPVQYTYTDANGCADTASSQIVVNAQPSVSFAALADVCENSGVVNLSGGAPNGGTYYGSGVGGGQYNPIGAGTFTLGYTYTDGNGCSDSASSSLTVNPLPIVIASGLAPLCETDGLVSLTGFPTGGTFSGTGVIGSDFNAAVGAGTYQVNYDYTDANSCSNSDSVIITVNGQPSVSFGALASQCDNGDTLTLNTGSPAGGVYAGSGVVAGQFIPTLVGAGSSALTYEYTDANGCSDTAFQSVTVNTSPSISWANLPAYCSNDASITLNASPSGGVYNGAGVSGNTFDPAQAGTGGLISYIVSNANGCSDSLSQTVTVNAAPTVNSGSYAAVCANQSLALNNGTPAGGVWSGSGVVGSTFSSASAGSFVLNYNYTDGNGCSNGDTAQVVVNALPTLSVTSTLQLCSTEGDTALQLVNPTGGTYTGSFITSNTFSTGLANVGQNPYTYSYTDANGCSNQVQDDIVVLAAPNVSFGDSNSICEDVLPFALTTAIPAGGAYSGSGVAVGSFDPASVGAGSYDLVYTYTASNGCSGADTAAYVVSPLPVVTFSDSNGICEDALAFGLTSGLPAGGTYTGTGVNAGAFDPAASGVGSFDLTYSFTSLAGCSNTDTAQFVVEALPSLTLTADADTVCVGAPVNLSVGGADTYLWSDGSTGGSVSVAIFQTQTISVIGTSLAGCSSSDSVQLFNYPQTVISLGNDTSITEGNSLSFGPGTGFNAYNWQDGSSLDTWTGEFDAVGVYDVWVVIADSNGCPATDTVVVTVGINGLASFDELNEWSIYPVPTNSNFFVSINSKESFHAKIQMIDLVGNVIEQRKVDVVSGQQTLTFDASNYANGQYFLTMEDEKGRKSFKRVIINK